MIDVVVYQWPGSRRSCFVASAMLKGIKACSDTARFKDARTYLQPEGDVAVWYGFSRPIMDGYRDAGKKAVYVDLGYWRREGFTGHHKLTINSRHPTDYFQKTKHPPDRFNKLHVPIRPWRHGEGDIIVAGMSGKGARAEGLEPEQWERWAVEELRKYTSRRVVYRPKPNWHGSGEIGGAILQRGHPQGDDVPRVLQNTYAIVTHHSNVAVDALLEGVPVFCVDGIARLLGRKDLSKIEQPIRPDGREQWAYDAAYTQWTIPEMESGQAWQHLKNERLVP